VSAARGAIEKYSCWRSSVNDFQCFLWGSVVDEALPAIVFGAYRQQKTRLVTKTGFVWWALSDSNTRPTD
jgi:hypothetical protein